MARYVLMQKSTKLYLSESASSRYTNSYGDLQHARVFLTNVRKPRNISKASLKTDFIWVPVVLSKPYSDDYYVE